MEGEEGRTGCSLFIARPSQPSSSPATPDHRRVEFGVISHDQDCIYAIHNQACMNDSSAPSDARGVVKTMSTREFATSSRCTMEVLVKAL